MVLLCLFSFSACSQKNESSTEAQSLPASENNASAPSADRGTGNLANLPVEKSADVSPEKSELSHPKCHDVFSNIKSDMKFFRNLKEMCKQQDGAGEANMSCEMMKDYNCPPTSIRSLQTLYEYGDKKERVQFCSDFRVGIDLYHDTFYCKTDDGSDGWQKAPGDEVCCEELNSVYESFNKGYFWVCDAPVCHIQGKTYAMGETIPKVMENGLLCTDKTCSCGSLQLDGLDGVLEDVFKCEDNALAFTCGNITLPVADIKNFPFRCVERDSSKSIVECIAETCTLNEQTIHFTDICVKNETGVKCIQRLADAYNLDFSDRKPFQFTIDTDGIDEATDVVMIEIAVNSMDGNAAVVYDLDCDGDGKYEFIHLTTNEVCSFKKNSGKHQIALRGEIPGLWMCASSEGLPDVYWGDEKAWRLPLERQYLSRGNQHEKQAVISIDAWGDVAWKSMRGFAADCKGLKTLPQEAPDLSHCTTISAMFYGAKSFNQNVEHWDVSHITDMSWLFYDIEAFNQPLNAWNVSHVENMNQMFYGAEAFNQPLNAWNVSHVENMNQMFYSADTFNQSLDTWNVSHVKAMNEMFYGAHQFNHYPSQWIVPKDRSNAMFHSTAVEKLSQTKPLKTEAREKAATDDYIREYNDENDPLCHHRPDEECRRLWEEDKEDP